MPNHITNVIEVDRDMAKIKKLMYGGKQDGGEVLFDFNKIDPIPEELKGTDSPPSKKDKETAEQLAKRLAELTKKYGHSDWYSWQCAHWGTKWNAYDAFLDGSSIQFDTAWSHPEPIIRKLSKIFPKAIFDVKYADEDIGSNFGHYIMIDGEITEDLTPSGQEGVKFACDVKGNDYEDYIVADVEKESSHEINL